MSRLLTLGVVLFLCTLAPLAVAQDEVEHYENGHTEGDTHGHVHDGDGAVQHDADGEAVSGDAHHADDHAADHGHEAGGHGSLGASIPLWSAIPFAGILLSIALFPLFAPLWWHHHFPKVSAFWALVFAIPFLFVYKMGAWHEIMHIYITDYVPFIILLWGLFTVSGGILLKGSLVGKPSTNFIILLIGTLLASWMGTTGAAMVLIRPLIRANKHRHYKVHSVVFFIFLVANVGGSLTPLGDPPLFLGFLHGVPFFWTFNIFPHFAVAAVMLLVIYFVLDTILYNKEKKQFALEETKHEQDEKIPLSLSGTHNIIFLLGIMGAVLFSGTAKIGQLDFSGMHVTYAAIIRDVFILLMIYLSMKTTKKEIREGNEFDWFPIKEVAYLFAGIFMCIIPMLAMLKAGSAGALGFIIEATKEPVQFFWITGTLSSFLDNAPTYLTFFNLAEGRLGLTDAIVNAMLTGTAHPKMGEFVPILKAISAGAVFFGAMTYIGNAPNFMVRSIAEESKVKMPSFFGYMAWSLAILVPVFVVITFIFFI
jgi:Na+/H+ antiporter NhaD/arsenite permease-like protein